MPCPGEQPDDADGAPGQESFFSNPQDKAPHWFHLSAASNHFQSADSLASGATPSCSSISGTVKLDIGDLGQIHDI